jgi:hypothetical protein
MGGEDRALPLRRMYTSSTAAVQLGEGRGVLCKRAKKGEPWAVSPQSDLNPLREWLFDADYIDSKSGGTCTSAVWIQGDSTDTRQERFEAARLLSRYRDEGDLLRAEVVVEREGRLEADRRAVQARLEGTEAARAEAVAEVHRLRTALRGRRIIRMST